MTGLPPARRFGRPLLGGLMASVLGLLFMEALLRAVPIAAIEIHRRAPARVEGSALFEHDPDLGWRGRAGVHSTFTGWEFTTDVWTNARGFRDDEVDAAKPAGYHRVVLLGDSITWGHGVERRERYGELLAAALRRDGVRAEVVNLAVAGYGTDQELLLWERQGRAYCADLVLLGLYENDVRENALAFQGRYPKPYFVRSDGGALRLENVPTPRVPDDSPAPPRGALREWLRGHVRLWAAFAFVRDALRRPDPSVAAPPAVTGESIELTAALIRRLAASVGRDDAAFGVVALPDVHDSPAPGQAASRSGVVPVLDLAPVFRGAGDGPLFYRLDGAHWTARAHRAAGEAIARWIETSALLARAPRSCP